MSNTPNRSSYIKLLVAGVVILLLLGGGIAAITLTKNSRNSKETNMRADALKEGPVVKVSIAKYSTAPKQIVLIGEAKPYESATIYAKISGYMDKIYVDKGDKVSKDQLLATVTNPEIDQQYAAAAADLDNKRKILDRDKKLVVKNFISQEEADLSQTVAARLRAAAPAGTAGTPAEAADAAPGPAATPEPSLQPASDHPETHLTYDPGEDGLTLHPF